MAFGMPLQTFMLTIFSHPILTITIVPLIWLLLRCIYRISPFHSLSHIPGPLIPRLSSLYLTYHAWIGDECTVVHNLHTKYGPIVRNGPSSVDIADGTALQEIYNSKGGGFRKAEFYGNFDIDGHKSIFSELVPENRAVRAKAINALFASSSLRQGKDVIYNIVELFVERLKEFQKQQNGSPTNLLPLTRGLALDAVTGYLFGRRYGGLDEKITAKSTASELSASGMVDTFVAVGRFWYLPSWAFQIIESMDARFGSGSAPEVAKSLTFVDEYVAQIVTDASTILSQASEDNKEKTTSSRNTSSVNGVTPNHYPSRLLTANISSSETRAQCKDLIFAGTDSTGMNLATILYYLAANPSVYQKLKKELEDAQPGFDDLQSLPYLRGVIREGLRLSMANPSRLPRVVPTGGWTFTPSPSSSSPPTSSSSSSTYFPAGTEISCTPFELHFNPDVFPSPRTFDPTRWLPGNVTEAMNRDSIPFGLGPRQCIARNLATVELYVAVARVVQEDCLRGARTVNDGKGIGILEWFNSHVVGGEICLVWS